jgi:two-component system NtrC family sensor kinase
MPGEMDGIDLAIDLARSRPALPVVLMTGHSVNLKKALSLGIEVIAKPCGEAAIAAAIRRAIERKAAERPAAR